MEQWKKDVAPYTDALHSQALRAVLLQKSEELRMSLEKSMSEVQAKMESQAEMLKQRLEQHLPDFQKKMAPFYQNLQSQLVQNSKEIKLDPYAQDLKAKLSALWESFEKISIKSDIC